MNTLYSHDFHAWCLEQAQYIEGKRFEDLDVLNLEDEIRALALREKDKLENHLEILFAHFLKWKYQKDSFIFPYLCRSWTYTIEEQRERIKRHLEENHSLKSYMEEALPWAYKRSRYAAFLQTNLPMDTFPKEMPFTKEQALDETWMPE